MKYFDVHTHLPKKNALLNCFPNTEMPDQNFSVGIHPWYLSNLTIQKQQLVHNVLEKNCLAIGECGLDRSCNSPIDVQISVFDFQLHLAKTLQKPLIIHCVKAFDLLIPKIKTISLPVIIHGFNQSEQIMKQLLEIEHVFLSFGKSLLHKSSNAQNALLKTPIHRFFLETDNQELISIDNVYAKASELLHLNIETLCGEIEKNKAKILN